jgi:putative transposase
MFQSRKVRLKPNKAQNEFFRRNFGASRFIYNWGLEQLNKYWEENKDKEKKDRAKRPSAYDLRKELNHLKKADEQYAWLKDIDSQSMTYAFTCLEDAFKRFFAGVSKYPKFKSKRDSRQSYSTKAGKALPRLKDSNHILLPKIGSVKFYNRNYLPEVEYKRATISTDGDYFYCSVLFDEEPKELPEPLHGSVGIDLGVKTAVTTSHGTTFHLKRNRRLERRLKRAQRVVSRRKKDSNRRNRARKRLRILYRKISNQRNDFIHKTTSTLVSENQVIRMEDLNVSGMLKNHHLAASIAHASFFEIKRQLTYKCEWYGRSLQLVSRFYPSSQLCSRCGARNKEMKNLNRRTFVCHTCGFSLDRDLNAAININNFCTHPEWETGRSSANDRGDSSSTKRRYSLSSVANR